MKQNKDSDLMAKIGATVDKWASTVLKDRLVVGAAERKPLGLWDRLKKGVSNLFYGSKYDRYNPYRWRNQFGDSLGVTETFSPTVFTLSEYAEIRGFVDSLESRLDEASDGFDKLRIAQIIRSAAQDLKTMLFNALKDNVQEPDRVEPKADGGPSVKPVDPVSGERPAPASSSPAAAPEGGARGATSGSSEPPKELKRSSLAAKRASKRSSGGKEDAGKAVDRNVSPDESQKRPQDEQGQELKSKLSSIDGDEESIKLLEALAREQPDLDQLAKDWAAYKSLLGVGMVPQLKVASGFAVEHPSGQPITYKWLLNKIKNHKNHELLSYVFDKDGRKMMGPELVSKIYNFIKTLRSADDPSVAQRLKTWAVANLHKPVNELKGEGRFRYIYENLISGSNFLDSIAQLFNSTTDDIKSKMIEFSKSGQ